MRRGKSKEEIKKEVKGLKEKIRTGEKIMISDVLPFKNYGYGTPSERLFTNFPAYIRKKIFAKAVPPSKKRTSPSFSSVPGVPCSSQESSR